MLRDRIFEVSPYEDFDPTPYPEDLQGWGSDDPLLTEAVRVLRPALICEVGSWKGRSAINMARAAKEHGINTEILCVDTWLGSSEHWLYKNSPDFFASLQIRNGMPQLYFTFLANVVRAGMSDLITPFPTTSETAASILTSLGIKFDLIYIDAAHEYESVKRDISLYLDLLSDDGLLIGDDYIVWEGVTRAANDIANARNLPLIGRNGKFLIPKGSVRIGIDLQK